MEGDGEGLVAIVQGLENSGVTLTVCNRSRQNSERSRPNGLNRIQINTRPDMPAADQRRNTLPAVAAPSAVSTATPAMQRTSVETSTGSDFSRMATASQICDGRYASSYKLAHCMISPTSPPEAVTEFPPQRKEPCRNQGNFEIGGHSSGQWNGHGTGHNVSTHGSEPVRIPAPRVKHYGGTQTWGEKGSSHRYSKSNHRESEAFAHSLRKYPSMAPFRTASTDLIEKLIRYTQAKHYQETSRSTKSMRSLRNQRSSENHDTNRVSTQQQTYTRRRDDNLRDNNNVQASYRGRTKNFKLYSPISDNRHLRKSRCRETTYSSSYDYLKAGSPPYGRANRSDGSPSPTRSRSPETYRSPERSRSPHRIRSPDRSLSPCESGLTRVDRPSRTGRPLRFERSVRDLSLSEMSKYIRSTIRQICNERPVVVQVCPKLKDRYNQHRKVCPNKNESSRDVMEFEEEESPEDQASGSVLSRFVQSFSGRREPSTEQTGCQCTRTNCYCTKATQCVNNPTATTKTATCSCLTTNTGCCRGMPCVCASKSQDQAYYNKRIDEEISEWLKNVPVHSIEQSESKVKRETIVKELRKTLKQLPDDENFEENATNVIQSFVEDFPLWNPGKDESDEKLFKNQLADMLAEKVKAVPRKPDRLRDIVKKWVVNMDFEDDGEEIDMESIIDNFVNKLKSLAADRPACDVKYTNLLRKEIIELLVELALKFDGDMAKLKKMANNLAIEIASIPRNVDLSGDTTKLASAFEENIADWICEHGLCEELKKDPKLIEGLTKRLNKLKSQGVLDEDIREEVKQFADDVGLAFETIDELIEELMKHISSSIQMKETENLDEEVLNEEISGWLRSLPGASDLHLTKFGEITKDLAKAIQENREQENENLPNDIVNYLADTGLSIDPADLGIYVEELMGNLGILLSDRYHKEQAKRVMIKDIFDIIECSPIPEEKKEEMRSRAHEIVEKNLREQYFYLSFPPDSVKETLLQNMDEVVSDIDLPTKSRLQLKSLLSASISKNFDKSFTRLISNRSDLKQSITNDVRNAVEELPIDPDKKKDLMQKIKETLSKNMNKPLLNNVKNNINDEICDVVERCPICEDRNVLCRIKKILSEVASKHLTIFLPNCVCDIQSEVEKDVSTVIDRSSIDVGKKRDLKGSIQDILTENEDRRLSDEVIRTIKEDINNVVSDLSIPQDKKDILKKAVSETVSQDFKDAGKAFSHDLNKIRDKLLDDITNVIEKSPIQRDLKSHLKDKLDTVLARNLDSSISVGKAHMILDDISEILRDVMPEEKRRSLTNKLAEKLGTQREEETDELTELINRLSIDSSVKDDMNKEIKAMLLKNLYNPLSADVRQQISEDLLNAIDETDLQEHEKKRLKSNITQAMAKELDKLITQDKEVPEVKDAIEKIIKNEIKNVPIPKDKQELLVKNLKDVLTENLVQPVTDEVKETIRERLEDIVNDLVTDEDKADAIKTQLRKVDSKDFVKSAQTRPRLENKESLWENKQTTNLKDLVNETLDNILPDMEQAVDEASIPREKKIELKNKLKNMAIKNFKKPLEDVADGLKDDIDVILDELNFPNDKRNKLNRELTAAVDKNMNDLQEVTKYIDTEYSDTQRRLSADGKYKSLGKRLMPIEEFDETKVKDNIFQGIEKIIEESGIPEEKKMEVKRKFNKIAAENLKKPFSADVQDATKNDITEIINDLPIPKAEKTQLKSALTNIVYDNVDNFRGKKVKDKPLHNIFQDTERAIEEAPIAKEKKVELKKKLKKLTTKDFNEIPLEDVGEALTDDVTEIIDELNLPKDKKNKLKSAVTTAADEYMSNIQTETRDEYTEFPYQQRRPGVDSRYKKIDTSLKSTEIVDATKVKDTVSQGIEKIIEDSTVPKEKKMELKKKLNNIVAENLKKPLYEDVQDSTKNGITEVIKDLPIPISEKNKLKTALTNMVDDNMDNLRGATQKWSTQEKKFKNVKDKPLQDIFQDTERAIEEAPIPREKKTELRKKLKRLTTKDFNEIPLENVPEELIDGMIEIIDELNLPKDKKNKLKSALTTATDEFMSNMQTATRDKYTKYSNQEGRPGVDSRYKKNYTGLKPIEVVDTAKVKDTILQGIDKITEDSNVPKEKKMELKRKLKNMANENLKKPFSEDVENNINNGIAKIIDDIPMPKTERNKLKSALTNMVGDNVDNLKGATQKFTTQDDKFIKVDDQPLQDIFQDTERAIEEAPIPREKKTELKKKLKKLTNKDFNEIPLENVPEELIDGMIEIIDELNLPKDKKNKLKSALTTATDEYMSNIQTAARNKYTEYPDQPLHEIFQDTERAIEEAPIPREKKTELKKKLKKLTNKDFNEIPLENVPEELIDGMIEIIDELNLPKDKKSKLKSALTTATDEYISNMQTATRDKYTKYSNQEGRPGVDSRYKKNYTGLKPIEVVDTAKVKDTILQEIDKITEDSNVPKEKKMELKRKLKNMANENLKKPFSEDVENNINNGIANIIDDIPMPKTERNKLKSALTNMVGDNVDNLKGATQKFTTQDDKFIKVDDQPLQDIFQDTERAIEEAPIPREKKTELKKKLKKLTNKDFNEIPLENVPEELIDGMIEIIDELNLPKDKKNKLKSALTTATDEYMSNMQTAAKNKYTEYPDQPLHEIFQDTERAIEEAPIPREKKTELKKKLKKLTNKDFNEIPLENVPEELIDGMIEIIDELNLPKDKNNKLKTALTTATDEYISNMQTATRDKYTKYSNQEGRPGVDSRYKKNYTGLKPIEIVDTAKVKDTILQGIDKITEDSNVPKEKKMELKRKLKNMANENLKKPFSEDVENNINNGIAKIIDDIPMPKTERNKLKSALTNMVGDNVDNLRGATQKLTTQNDKFIKVDDKPLQNIFQETERAIEEAPLPREKKNETKKKLENLTNKDFNKIPFVDVVKPPTGDMIEIIDELNLPKDKKNDLKSALTTATDEYMSNMRTAARNKYTDLKPIEVVDAAKVKDTILQQIDNITEDSNVPKEKKTELKRKLKNMANENLKKPFSEDVENNINNGIAKIIDDIPMPKTERNKLKSALTNMVDDNVDNLRGATQKFTTQDDKFIKVDDKPLHDIFQETERAIEGAPVAREKKNELKKKLKYLNNKDFNKIPLEDVVKPPTGDMIEIIDELNLPKDKKNDLKSALTTATDEYMSNMRTAARNKYTDLKPIEVVDAAKVKDTILRQIDNITEDSNVPKEKKMELKRKLKNMANENLKKPFSEDVENNINNGIAKIIDDIPMPKTERNKLKSALTNMVDDNVDNLRGATQKFTTQDDKFIKVDDKPLHDIFQETERAIEGAPVPREKKNELKKKLKYLNNKDFNKIPLEDVVKPPTGDMIEIIDELNLPKDKKNDLKSALTTATDEYMSNMRTAARNKYTDLKPIEVVDAAKVKDNILQQIDNITEDSNVPKEKKMELKRKLKNVANENLKKPFSEDVENNINNGIAKIIDDIPMPKTERNKLKSALTNMVDDNVDNLRGATQKFTTQDDKFIKVDDKPLLDIFQETERAIEGAPVPREKKNELKKKLKYLNNKDFNKIPLEDVAKPPTGDMIEIIDELNLPKDKKNDLKSALTTATDEYMSNMQTAARNKYTDLKPIEVVDAAKVKDTILQQIDNITEDSNVPKEKKTELKRKLKNMANENLKKPFSEDVENNINHGIAKIIDDIPMPKTERNKLKNALTNMVDDNVDNLRGATQKFTTQDDKFIKVDDKPLHDIFQETERAIERAPLPREKKNELKNKLKNVTFKDFNKIPLEDVVEPPTGDMIEIIDELNLPKDKKNKLKSALTTATDEYKSNMQTAARDKYTANFDQPLREIFKELERAIEEAPLSSEKKNELKKKLKKLTTKDFNKIPLEDVAETPADDMIEIIDELNLPKDKKNKLKSSLTTATHEYMRNMQKAAKVKDTEYPDQPLREIFTEIERAIEEAPLSREKKNELKKKLKKLTTKDYNEIPLEDVAKPQKDDIIEIIDELNLPKDEKNNLKSALTTATDEYMSNVRTAARDKYNEYPDQPLREIFTEMERAIEESPLPREKKNELKRKLKKLTTKNYNEIPLEDVAKPPTDDMIEIIDELNLPKDEKNNLKSALTTATDEYMSNVRTAARDKYNEYPDQPLREIFKEMERAIEESPLPREKKNELKRKLKKLTTKNYNEIPLEDVAKPPTDDMIVIIDELNLPKDEKNNLKSALTTATDEYMSNVRTAARDKYNEYPDQPLREIFKEMERATEEAPLSREKKKQLTKKLKKLTTKDYNEIPLEDVAKPPIDNMIEIIDELNLPKNEKNNLKSALTTATDEYMSNVRTAAKDKYNEYPDQPLREIFKEMERATEEAPLSREKKNKLTKKLKKLTTKDYNEIPLEDVAKPPIDDMIEIIDELNLPKDKKNYLKSGLTTATDEYMSNVRTAARDEYNKYPDQPLHETFQEMKRAIEESPLPRDKKNELKKKLKKLTNIDYNKIPLEDVAEVPIGDMIEIIDEMNLPKDKKNKLKSAITTAVDEYKNNMQTDQRRRPGVNTKYKKVDSGLKPIEIVDAAKVKNTILQGIEKIIEDSTVPKEKKIELKRKLKNITAENLKKPFSKNMEDTIKNGIADIIDELPISKTEKNQLNNALTNMLDENIPREIEDKPLHNIFKYMKRAIGEAPIPKEEKIALKKKLQNLATKDFNKKSLEDIAEELKVGMIDIIDELNLPKDKKNNLKNVVLDMIDENTNILQSQPSEFPSQVDLSKESEDRTQRNILQGFEKVIDEAPIPREINTELNKKLKDIATKNFKKPWSDDIADVLKDDTNKIVDETNLPNDKKNNLKDELTDVVNENMSYPKYETKPTKPSRYQKKQAKSSSAPRFVIDETNVKASMKEEVKKSVQQSEIADADKSKLNLQLLKMISGMLAEFDEAVDERMKQIFDKYGIKPSYQKTLAEEYNKLLDIILKGGDLEAARRNLIEKLMRDLNLSEEVATALVDDLIALAREMAQNEDIDDILKARETVTKEPTEDGRYKYSIDPSYIKKIPLKAFDKILQPKQSQMAPEYKEQSTSERRRGDQAPPDIKECAALSTGNINYSLKELIATNKSVRKQWSKHLDDAITKLPLLRKENNDLKNKLAIYDETGQINILSNLSRSKEETNPIDNFKSNKQVAPKPALKNNKGKLPPRLSKIEEAFAFNNTTKQKSPFTPNAKQDFISNLKETINNWMKNEQVEIEPNEKNKILEELTKDIIDRQKYLQTFGEKPSQLENLEYLKFQVYRRLNGLVPIEALKQIIENTKELVASIENIEIPQLVVSPLPSKTKDDQLPPPPTKPKNDQLPPPPTKPKNDQQKRNAINFKKPSSPTQRKLGPADILGIHSKATNTTTADGVLHTVDNDDGVEDDSDMEFSPGQASTPAKPIDYLDKVTDCVTTWVESMPIDMEPEMRMDVINDLVTDIVDRQKYLQVHPEKKFSEEDEIENLKFQVFKRLEKNFEPGSSVTPSLVKIEELYRMINGDGQKKSLTAKQAQEFQTALNLEISAILNDYQICCDKRELLPSLANELIKLRNSGTDQDEIVENLIDTINRLTYLRGDPAEELAYKLLYRTKKLIATIRGDVSVKRRDFKDAVMSDIGDVFQGSPMSEAKRRMMENQLAEGYAKDLGIPLEDSYVTMSGPGSESKKERYGMSFNGLSNFIDTWLSSMPDDDTKDEDEIMDMKKQRMYCLMHKIGEMNVDPEIFNDESLYEAVLREELQHLFGDVSANDEEFKALKEDLIEKALEAQRRAHDELAGQNYKNNLRDTISKLLPDQRNLSKEDQATIETLKDQLADAYIDLHYSGNNESQRDKLKRKISNEINTFCRDYLNRNPCSPLNNQKLNHDLYVALSKVPLPAGDSIKYEVEQARIREEINDWVKELPLQPQNPTELLARNKLIYVLSKKLFDIEIDEQEEDTDNDLMRKKIVTFLNKLPLESDEDNETIADTLIDKLKASEESRKYNASANVTIDAFGKVSAADNERGMKAPICPGNKPLFDKQKPCGFPKVCRRQDPRPFEAFPPCNLSPEDRDHLDRIRRRTCLSPSCVTSLMRNKCSLSLGPPPIDVGSQSVPKPFGIEEPHQNRICPYAYEKTNRSCPRVSANLPHQPCPRGKTETCEMEKTHPGSLCPAAFEKSPRTCPGPSRPTLQSCQMRRHTISSTNVSDCTEEVQPQVLIKQYYWDPLNKNSIDSSEMQQSGRSSRRQSDSIPCASPRPAPCASPRPATCRPAPCSPPRPAFCTSSRPPPCRPPPCYSSRPPPCQQSMPCETRTSCPQPTPGPCRRPSSGKLKQQNTCPPPKSPRQNSSERYSYFDPLNSFQRSSHRDIPSSRSPCTPSPCMSSFGISQYTPPGSPGFAKRFNECRMPKRDGLQGEVPSNNSKPSQKERVIELGSLDDVGSTRPKKRHSDQSDWPKFHEDDNFWAAPMRRVILDEGIDESLVMERERREERVSCRCKERLVPKSGRSQPATVPNQPCSQSSEDGQNLKRCSKCCGIHCPYPSFLYFRQ